MCKAIQCSAHVQRWRAGGPLRGRPLPIRAVYKWKGARITLPLQYKDLATRALTLQPSRHQRWTRLDPDRPFFIFDTILSLPRLATGY